MGLLGNVSSVGSRKASGAKGGEGGAARDRRSPNSPRAGSPKSPSLRHLSLGDDAAGGDNATHEEHKAESPRLAKKVPSIIKSGLSAACAVASGMLPKGSSESTGNRSRASTFGSLFSTSPGPSPQGPRPISRSDAGPGAAPAPLDLSGVIYVDASRSPSPASPRSGSRLSPKRKSFFFSTGRHTPPASPVSGEDGDGGEKNRKRSSTLGVLGDLDSLTRLARNSSSLQETVLERFEHAEELRAHRNTKLWCYWGMSKEHKELEFIRNWKTRIVARSQLLKQACRHGSLDGAERRSTWLSMGDINVTSKQFRNTVTTYELVFRNKVAACAGCQELHMDHLHNFGARFLRNGGSLWAENLFDKHLLTAEGIKCAKRIMLVLHAKWALDYCPQIPDMVCICLLYLTEKETFGVIDGILTRSRASRRWSSDTENIIVIPVGKADALVFVRTFVNLFKERLPALYRNLVELGRDTDELEQVVLNWFERFFVCVFPLRYVVRIFDCFMVEGPKVLYRVALTLFKNARSQLLVECSKRKRGEAALADILESVLRTLGFAPDHHSQHSRSAYDLEKSGKLEASRVLDLSALHQMPSQGSEAGSKLSELFDDSVVGTFLEDSEVDMSALKDDEDNSDSNSDCDMFDDDGTVVKNEAQCGNADDDDDDGGDDDEEAETDSFAIGRSTSLGITTASSLGDDDLDREEGLLSPRNGRSPRSPRAAFGGGNFTLSGSRLKKSRPALRASRSERPSTAFGVDADGDELDDSDTPMSPRYLKSVQLEPSVMIEGASRAEYNIAANNLTLRARRHSAPRCALPFGSPLPAPRKPLENQVIVVEKKYGSKTFYSESSLFTSDSAAGAALMERMIGADVANTRLVHAPQQDSFEFKVFLAACFSWRSIKRKALAKRDEANNRAVMADPYARISDPVPTLHFPHRLLQESTILRSVDMATRLVSWLPMKIQYKVFKQIKLLYTTNRDGRSLDALYEACAKHKRVSGTIILIECLPQEGSLAAKGAGASAAGKGHVCTVVGAYSSKPLQVPTGKASFHGDDHCFLFRLAPRFAAKAWKPESAALSSVLSTAQVSDPGGSQVCVSRASSQQQLQKPQPQSPPRQQMQAEEIHVRHSRGNSSGSLQSGLSALLSSKSDKNAGALSNMRSFRSTRTITSSMSSSRSASGATNHATLTDALTQHGSSDRNVVSRGPRSEASTFAGHGRLTQTPTARSTPAKEAQAFLSENMGEMDLLQETASRSRFVTCRSNAIEFGGRSAAFVTKHGKRVSRQEIQDMSDEQFTALAIKKELAGPGLTMDQLLDEASTSWCAAYENRPLCMSTDVIKGLSSDLIRGFYMGTVEVFGIGP